MKLILIALLSFASTSQAFQGSVCRNYLINAEFIFAGNTLVAVCSPIAKKFESPVCTEDSFIETNSVVANKKIISDSVSTRKNIRIRSTFSIDRVMVSFGSDYTGITDSNNNVIAIPKGTFDLYCGTKN